MGLWHLYIIISLVHSCVVGCLWEIIVCFSETNRQRKIAQNANQCKTVCHVYVASKEIGFGKVMQPLRLSLVGKLAGPDLFEIMTMIGKETTIERIQNAVSNLG